MASRKITVLNPAGYQEIFQAGDDLLIDGDVNLQSNALTGLPSPSGASDASTKAYVDSLGSSLSSDISALNDRVDNLDGVTGDIELSDYVAKAGSTMTGFLTLSGNPTQNLHSATKLYVDNAKTTALNAIGDGTITFSASQNLSITGTSSFTTNESGDVTISLQGPDLSGYIQTPTADGSFVVVKAGGNISYSSVVDGGTY